MQAKVFLSGSFGNNYSLVVCLHGTIHAILVSCRIKSAPRSFVSASQICSFALIGDEACIRLGLVPVSLPLVQGVDMTVSCDSTYIDNVPYW